MLLYGATMPRGEVALDCAKRSRRATWSGAVTWLVAAGVTIAYELVSLAHQPRRTHPTLSSYLTTISAHPLGKALLFALWLAAAWWIWDEL